MHGTFHNRLSNLTQMDACRSQVTHVNESRHTFEWVMSPAHSIGTQMNVPSLANMDESCHTYECVMSRDMWVCRCVGVWLCGCVGVWEYECVGVWVSYFTIAI